LPKAEVFHFAGHAVSGADRIGLVLAGGPGANGQSFLDASQLQKISLMNTKLAVFSACSTEKTADGSFDDSQSLVHSFLRAGVHRVVASRWDVDSAATETLMNEFYDRLLSGTPTAQALRLSELQIQKSKDHSHPYYWAPFSLFGKS
jgi:CHAT domain-containing protein